MVLLSLTSRLNKVVGPFFLRCGLRARFILDGGTGAIRDSPTLDAMFLLPVSQKIISLEVQDDAIKKMKSNSKEPSAFDRFSEAVFDQLFGTDPKEQRNKGRASSPTSVRLDSLEQYLRPILIPNERWSDVIRWHFNNRFLKWARAEFLIAKHGDELKEALRKNPKLRLEPLLARKGPMLDVLRGGKDYSEDERMVLPMSRMVTKAFRMEHWNQKKEVDAEWRRMTEVAEQLGGQVINIPGSSLRFADIPAEADLSELSLEDLLEVAGGHVASCGPLNALCEDAGIYELWTKDYVAALASYVLNRSEKFHGDTIVLDVGAGDGLLAHFLRDYIRVEAKHRLRQEQHPSPTRKTRKRGTKRVLQVDHSMLPQVVAIDNFSWNIDPKAKVERLSVKDALIKYAGGKDKQLILLCSWMPMGADWTADFRASGADEYILIGECDDGNCGDNWETWGNKDFFPDYEEEPPEEIGDPVKTGQVTIPYVLDGFRRTDFDALSCHQFSRFDSSVSKNSKTVSFRRISR